MPSLADRLGGFADALVDPALMAPPGLVGPDGQPSQRRFAVYRNNVVAGLVGALKANYPAVCRIVGEEFFAAMARVFAVSQPPASPILLDYGIGFADFISGFEPVADVPYLADVARLERAWLEAYHAPEAKALTPETLSAIPADDAAGLAFVLHPSLRLIRSRFPVLTIWRMNIGDGVPAPVDFEAAGEDVLVVRPEAQVEARPIPPGGCEFVDSLRQGHSLAEAMKTALGVDPRFDLAGNIRDLIAIGALSGWRLANEPRCAMREIMA